MVKCMNLLVNRRAKSPYLHMVRDLRMPKMAAGISTPARSRVFRLVDKPSLIFFIEYLRLNDMFSLYSQIPAIETIITCFCPYTLPNILVITFK